MNQCKALNHVVIIGKYYFFVNSFYSKVYIFDKVFSLVCDKIRLEKLFCALLAYE